MFEEGPQQHLVGCRLFDRVDDFVSKVTDIIGYEVGRIPMLGVAPHLFDRVELRGIRRKPFDDDTETKPGDQPLGRRSMRRQTIHDQDDTLGKTAAQPADETIDFIGANVVIVEVEVQP
jgi:hypothetical protein